MSTTPAAGRPSGPFRAYIALGALALAVAVLAGAFGAHVLKSRLPVGGYGLFRTAIDYQMLHGVGVVLVGIAGLWLPQSRALRLSGALLLAGIVLFCGSLFLLAGGAPRTLGLAAPAGGMAFVAGWIALAWAAVREF